jgi:hypothetical protein
LKIVLDKGLIMSKSIQHLIPGFVYVCHSEESGSGWTDWDRGKVSEPFKIGIIQAYTISSSTGFFNSFTNQADVLFKVQKRINVLQIGNSNYLQIRLVSGMSNNVYVVENNIQKKYKKYHIRGEWYNLSSKQVQNIGKLMETLTEERNHYNLHKVLL